MVELRPTGSDQHTRQVRLKRGLVCLNDDRHGLLCHCRHQSLLIATESQSTSCCSFNGDKLPRVVNQAPSGESVVKDAQHERHFLQFSTGVTTLFVVQSAASTNIGRRIHAYPSASGHSTHCWAYTQCTGDTNSQVVKPAHSFAFNL